MEGGDEGLFDRVEHERYKWSDLSPPLYSSPSKVTLIAADPFHVVIARQQRK